MAQFFHYDGTYIWDNLYGMNYGRRQITIEEAVEYLREKYPETTIQKRQDGLETINGFLNKGYLEVSREKDIVQVLYAHDFQWYLFAIEADQYDKHLKKT